MRCFQKYLNCYHQLEEAGITKKVSQLVVRYFVRFIFEEFWTQTRILRFFISREA
jgi:hypothetical protein